MENNKEINILEVIEYYLTLVLVVVFIISGILSGFSEKFYWYANMPWQIISIGTILGILAGIKYFKI